MLKLAAIAATLLLGDTGIPPASFWDGGAYILNKAPIYVTLGDAGSGGGGGGGAVTLWDGGVYILNPQPIFVTLGDGGISVAFPAVQAVTIVDGGPVTVAIPQPLAVTVVDGGLNVNNFPASQTVTIAQPVGVSVVDGGLNVNNLPVQPYAVTVVDGGLNVNNFPSTQAVTQSGAWSVQVDGGHVTLDNALPLFVTLGDGGVITATITQPLAVTAVDGGLNVNNLPAQPYAVSVVDGGLNVNNFPALPYAVTVVDGGLNVNNLPLAATIVDGGLNVNNFPAFPWPVTVVDGGGESVQITDGTNTATVKAANVASVSGDKSLVVQINPNQPNLTTPWTIKGRVTALTGAPDNPLPIGNLMLAYGSDPSHNSAGQIAQNAGDVIGRTYVSVDHPNPFFCNLTGVNSNTQCQATPGGTNFFYIETVTFSSIDGGAFQIASGNGTNCSDGGVVVGSWYLPANGTVQLYYQPAVKEAQHMPLCCNSSAGEYSCTITGYQQP